MRFNRIDKVILFGGASLLVPTFDEHYAGAMTRAGGVRVHLKGASLDETEDPFHPFQSGLITRITAEERFVVATRGGHLKVEILLKNPLLI